MVCVILLAVAITWLVLLHFSLVWARRPAGWYPTSDFIRAHRRRRDIARAKAEMNDLYCGALTEMVDLAKKARSRQVLGDTDSPAIEEGDDDEPR